MPTGGDFPRGVLTDEDDAEEEVPLEPLVDTTGRGAFIPQGGLPLRVPTRGDFPRGVLTDEDDAVEEVPPEPHPRNAVTWFEIEDEGVKHALAHRVGLQEAGGFRGYLLLLPTLGHMRALPLYVNPETFSSSSTQFFKRVGSRCWGFRVLSFALSGQGSVTSCSTNPEP